LAQPEARHNAALLQEVSQVLVWAFGFDPRGPGALEEGASWDWDLQARCHRTGSDSTLSSGSGSDFGTGTASAKASGQETQALPVPAHLRFNPSTGQFDPFESPPHHRLELSLSVSGTPAFAHAFRDQWGAP
jgi:hypothetical protein